jgi:hypothetical protein
MAAIDPGLKKWVDDALDLGLRCFKDGDRIPFIILIAGDDRRLMNLESADGMISEALLEGGRGLIRQFTASGHYYVLVWDGYLTMAGKRQDAVFAEAGAAGEGPGFLFAQRYKESKAGKLSKVGKPLIAAEVAHLWSASGTEREVRRKRGAPIATVFSPHCVYTILRPNLLADAARQGGPTTFQESKRWVTGQQLWQQAQDAGVGFPVLLGNAAKCSQLDYWGLLTAVEIGDEGTRFTVDRVRPLAKSHSPQELVLRRTGEHIAPHFLRPYAICHTPDFIED